MSQWKGLCFPRGENLPQAPEAAEWVSCQVKGDHSVSTAGCFPGWPVEVQVYMRRIEVKAGDAQYSEEETLLSFMWSWPVVGAMWC